MLPNKGLGSSFAIVTYFAGPIFSNSNSVPKDALVLRISCKRRLRLSQSTPQRCGAMSFCNALLNHSFGK